MKQRRVRAREGARMSETACKWNVWKFSQTHIGIMVLFVRTKKRKVVNKKSKRQQPIMNTMQHEKKREKQREDKEMPLMKIVYSSKREIYLHIYDFMWSAYRVCVCLFVYKHIVDGLKPPCVCVCLCMCAGAFEYDINWNFTHKQTNERIQAHTRRHTLPNGWSCTRDTATQ